HRPASTAIYTLSLHDALPIFAPLLPPPLGLIRLDFRSSSMASVSAAIAGGPVSGPARMWAASFITVETCFKRAISLAKSASPARSEEHTSELQSLRHLVCRLL